MPLFALHGARSAPPRTDAAIRRAVALTARSPAHLTCGSTPSRRPVPPSGPSGKHLRLWDAPALAEELRAFVDRLVRNPIDNVTDPTEIERVIAAIEAEPIPGPPESAQFMAPAAPRHG